MTEAGSVHQASLAPSSEAAELSDLEHILNAQRIYEELGGKRNLSPLIDSPPKLLLEEDLELRLHSRDAKKRSCRVYVFDKYFLVASARVKKKKKTGVTASGISTAFTSASSSDGKVLWFGDKKSSLEDSSGNSEQSSQSGELGDGRSSTKEAVIPEDTDSDSEDDDQELEELDIAESEARRKKKRFNLKMWIDLRRVKPKFQRAGSDFAIMITYVTKVQEQISPGEFRYDTAVDMAEIWLSDDKKAKAILGRIQDAVNKNSQDILQAHSDGRLYQKKSTASRSCSGTSTASSEADSDAVVPGSDGSREPTTKSQRKSNSARLRTSSATSSQASSNTKRSRGRANLRKGKAALKATTAFLASSNLTFDEYGRSNHNGVVTMRDVQRKYQDYVPDIAQRDEGKQAEYTVVFNNPQMGLALSSSKQIGPFVCRLVENGLAEVSGVALGDRLVSINDNEVPTTMAWQECVGMIKQQSKGGERLRITFLRKQKNEIDRQKRAEEKRKQEEEAIKGDEPVAVENGKVEPVEATESEAEVINPPKKIDGRETVEFVKRSSGNFTIKRKRTGKRKFAKKNEVLRNMRFQVTNIKEFNEFRKNKTRMFDLHENIPNLFETVIGYLETKKEKTCIHALKEIYDTEKKYNAELNALREFHVGLSMSYKNVICKNLKTGRPFCEHRRPLRFCSQPSSTREPAVDRKVIDSIFLNLKPIMKSNVFLWKNLQSNLGDLWDKVSKKQRVEVHDMLEVFCKVFAEIAPFLQIYWQYCQRYPRAVEKHKALRAENEYFRKIVIPIEKKNKVSLSSLLSRPVQRITKYHLLFTTLTGYVRKYINEELEAAGKNPQTEQLFQRILTSLEKACKELLSLAGKVNTKVGEADNLDQMVEVYGQIGGKDGVPNLLQPHRRFNSKHVVAFEHVTKEEIENEATVYLFNDMMAIAVPKSRRNPSLFGSNSKVSFALQKLKYFSAGKDKINSNGNSKKLSLKSGSSIDASSKRKSVRSPSNRSTKPGSKKSVHSSTSKDSRKDEFYEVIAHFALKTIGEVKKKTKQSEGEELFGVDLYYSVKHQQETEIGQVIFWLAAADERDALYDLILKVKTADKEKKSELRRAREKHGSKKKKTKRFKKKFDKHKKNSVEKAKNNALRRAQFLGDEGAGVKKSV